MPCKRSVFPASANAGGDTLHTRWTLSEMQKDALQRNLPTPGADCEGNRSRNSLLNFGSSFWTSIVIRKLPLLLASTHIFLSLWNGILTSTARPNPLIARMHHHHRLHATKLIFKFSHVPILTYLASHQMDIFWTSFGLALLPHKASLIYNSPKIV